MLPPKSRFDAIASEIAAENEPKVEAKSQQTAASAVAPPPGGGGGGNFGLNKSGFITWSGNDVLQAAAANAQAALGSAFVNATLNQTGLLNALPLPPRKISPPTGKGILVNDVEYPDVTAMFNTIRAFAGESVHARRVVEALAEHFEIKLDPWEPGKKWVTTIKNEWKRD
jgi:hypothetical protein